MMFLRHPTILAAGALIILAACAPNAAQADGPRGRPPPTLTPFGSEEAFTAYQQAMVAEWEERIRRDPPLGTTPLPAESPPMGYPMPRGEPVEAAPAAGLHEAGIVKAVGDYLVILRDGRLHTVRIGGGALDTVASIDAYPPGARAEQVPVDGIFASGETVIVTGHSAYLRAVQVGLFRLDAAGGLTHQASYQLRTGGGEDPDPAVRLVGGRLAVYSARDVWAGDPRGIGPYLPAVRRVGGDTAWTPLADPARIYRPAAEMRADDGITVHVLTSCDPSGGALGCRSTVVYAPRQVVHHVSAAAAYAWTVQRPAPGAPESAGYTWMLYRLPLDGAAPTALRVSGRPESPHAFEETADGKLYVLLSGARVPPRWEAGRSDLVSVLRVPLSAFGDGAGTAPGDAYQRFPNPGSSRFHGRFVGDWVLYGTEAGPGMTGVMEEGTAWAARRDGTGEPVALPLPAYEHPGVLGFTPAGGGAVMVSKALDSLHYLSLRLGAALQPGEPYARKERWTGDVDARAEFYQPDGPDAGTLGLALSGFGHTASVIFLRHEGATLREIGELAASAPPGVECAPCGGYGFARPIFLRGRIFALVADELVEGVMEGGRVRELRRVRYTPPAAPRR